MREPTIAILSDRNLFREGIVQLLHSEGFEHVTEHRSGAELLSALGSTVPRLLFVDLDHGADEPVALLKEVRQRSPSSTVVIIGTTLQSAAVAGSVDACLETPSADTQVLMAVTNLALTSPEGPITLPLSQEALQQRQRWSTLTPRQREVLSYLSNGSDNLKIAAHLGISERAVKAHVSALLSLFGAENRTELAVLACRAGLRPPLRSRPKPHVPARAQSRIA